MTFLRILFLLFLHSCAVFSQPLPITVYIRDSFYENYHKVLEENTFPGEITFIRLSGSSLMGRLRMEGAGTKADVVIGIDSCMMQDLKDTGVVAENDVNPNSYDLPVAWNPLFVPFAYGYIGVLYDTRRGGALPATFEEFMTQNQEDSVLLPNPRTSTVGLVFLHWMQDQGPQGIETWALFEKNIHSMPKGLAETFGLFLKGKAAFMLAYTTSADYAKYRFNNSFLKPLLFERHPFHAYVAFQTPKGRQDPRAQKILECLISPSIQKNIAKWDALYPVTRAERNAVKFDVAEPQPLLNVANFSRKSRQKLIQAWERNAR